MDPRGVVRELMGRAQRTGKMYSDPQDESAVVVIAEEESSVFPVLKWRTLDQNLLGQVVAYYGDSANFGYASFEAIGPTTGDEAIASLRADNQTDSKFAFLQMSSTGVGTFDLRSGTNTAVGSQAVVIKSQTSATSSDNTALYVDSYTSGTVANGFGTALVMRAEDSGGNMIDQIKLVGGWKDKTAGTADANFQLSVAANSSYNAVMTFSSAGKMTVGGSGVDTTHTYFFEFHDGNDLQAMIDADTQALNDDGWGLGAVDYKEFLELREYGEPMEPGDIVFVRERKISKHGPGTAMVVSTSHDGFAGGVPLNWHKKWERDANGKKVKLNPEWDSTQTYVTRNKRPDEWRAVAFVGQISVKVRGKVIEGDYIIPSGKNDGYGKAVRAAKITFPQYRRAVGIAWGDKTDDGDGTVMVAVGVK